MPEGMNVPQVEIRLFEVDMAVHERFFRELADMGAEVNAGDGSAIVVIEAIADCDALGAVLAPLLPPHKQRFKLIMDGPGSLSKIYTFAVPGREAATLADQFALSAGLQ
jgi:hypothetical protein